MGLGIEAGTIVKAAGLRSRPAPDVKVRLVFQAFVDRLIESDDSEGLREGMAEAAAALDLCCFAYLSLPRRPNASPVLLSNYPSTWTRYYLQRHYERIDPVIIQALRHPTPFRWGLGVGL